MEQYVLSRDVELFPERDGRVTVFHRRTRKTYVLGKKEGQVLQRFDGMHTAEMLAEECAFFSSDELRRMAETFRGMELFAGTERKQRFGLRSLWRLRLRLFNPNRLLQSGARRTKAAFFLMLLLSILAVAAGEAAIIGSRSGVRPFPVDAAEIQTYLMHPQLRDILVLLFLNGACLFLHELAHAVTARYYGVSVPEIGVMLYAFIPAAYTNVTGMRLLRKKGPQIMILSAGTIVNLGLIGLCYALMPLTGGTAAAAYLVMLVATNAVTILTNLVVFLKFDSYYILEVLLDEPGLQERAFASLKGLLRPAADAEDASRRLLYCVYALSCIVIIPILVLGNLLSMGL